MSQDYRRVFKLPEEFSKQQLKYAYLTKIQQVDAMNIDRDDRRFYIDSLTKLYKEARASLTHSFLDPFHNNDFWNSFDYRFNTFINNNIANIANNANVSTGFRSSTKSVRNADGTYTVIQQEETVKDGVSNKQINSYIQKQNGEKEYIDYDIAKNNLKKIEN